MKTTINCKRGGHLVVFMGGMDGEVALSSSSSSSHNGNNVGQKGGPGNNDNNCGRRGCVVAVSFRCAGKDSGKEDEDVDDIDDVYCGRRGGRIFVVFVIVVVSDPS